MHSSPETDRLVLLVSLFRSPPIGEFPVRQPTIGPAITRATFAIPEANERTISPTPPGALINPPTTYTIKRSHHPHKPRKNNGIFKRSFQHCSPRERFHALHPWLGSEWVENRALSAGTGLGV